MYNAASYGFLDVVRLLTERGADPSIGDVEGKRPTHPPTHPWPTYPLYRLSIHINPTTHMKVIQPPITHTHPYKSIHPFQLIQSHPPTHPLPPKQATCP